MTKDELRIKLPEELLRQTLQQTQALGASLRKVQYDPDFRSTTAVFSQDGFTGYLSLYNQQELLAEFNIRSMATNYAAILEKVFRELRQHSGPYAPRISFGPEELPPHVKDVQVSFGEPDGNNYHSAEITLDIKGLNPKPRSIRFGISKKY